jgi:hypothetical protein
MDRLFPKVVVNAEDGFFAECLKQNFVEISG